MPVTLAKTHLGGLLGETFCLGYHLLNGANHVECNLGQMIVFTNKDLAEALDGFLEGYQFSGMPSEDFGHLEWLGQETLDFPGTCHRELILLRQFIHTQDGNNILKGFVILEDFLHTTCNIVVLLPNNIGIHDTGCGIKGIYSWVDTQFGDSSGQHSGGVQPRKKSKTNLHGCDGALLGCGNTFLHATHVSGQGWLVTHSRGDTTQQGRHLRTGLGETENVVNEKQYILSFLITEIFSNSESSQSDTSTSAWGSKNLNKKTNLGCLVLERNNARLNHLVVEIISFTGTFAHTSKYGVTTMSLSYVVNQLHDKHSFTHTGTTKETNLTTLSIGGKKIHNLNASYENLLLDAHLHEFRSFSVNGGKFVSFNGAPLVNWFPNDVNNASQGFSANGNLNG
uniref:Uncharacterized protein n=1 Tax=Lutzomyia longipalpis TaxID=7200 RepID=A0A1B0CLT7_LUTLO